MAAMTFFGGRTGVNLGLPTFAAVALFPLLHILISKAGLPTLLDLTLLRIVEREVAR